MGQYLSEKKTKDSTSIAAPYGKHIRVRKMEIRRPLDLSADESNLKRWESLFLHQFQLFPVFRDCKVLRHDKNMYQLLHNTDHWT